MPPQPAAPNPPPTRAVEKKSVNPVRPTVPDLAERPWIPRMLAEKPADAKPDSKPGAAPASEQVKTPQDGVFFLDHRKIQDVTTTIATTQGEMPKDAATEVLQRSAGLPEASLSKDQWDRLCFFWDAPDLAYRPLYFEEVNLERYGYAAKHPYLVQPFISGARFFLTVPALPYLLVAQPWCETNYTLGHYRPGSDWVPYRYQYPPLDAKAGLVEGGLAAGAAVMVP